VNISHNKAAIELLVEQAAEIGFNRYIRRLTKTTVCIWDPDLWQLSDPIRFRYLQKDFQMSDPAAR
jgi:hypothetical protein